MATLTRNLVSALGFTVDVTFNDQATSPPLRVVGVRYANLSPYDASWVVYRSSPTNPLSVPGVPNPIPPGTTQVTKSVPTGANFNMEAAPAGAATDFGPADFGVATTLG